MLKTLFLNFKGVSKSLRTPAMTTRNFKISDSKDKQASFGFCHERLISVHLQNICTRELAQGRANDYISGYFDGPTPDGLSKHAACMLFEQTKVYLSIRMVPAFLP